MITLSTLSNDTMVSIDFVYVLHRLVQAKDKNDIEVEAIIKSSIQRLNNCKFNKNLPFEPIMNVGEIKQIFQDFIENPPPLRLYNCTDNYNTI
ncbi:MAG: hypothetical protein FWC95_05285 [Defluviitaleaceae bacterium]|nr:hypothetical protein [Defluviitaleaceae bacterium]